MSKSLQIVLKKNSNIKQIEKNITQYVNNNAEKEKVEQSKIYFVNSIKELIKSGNDVYSKGGNMTFDRTISYENLSINVKAKFIKSESIISKIIDLFKR